MTVARALVHLGPIKTGTTALSRYLTLTTQAGTTPEHILFPTGGLWFGHNGDIVRQRMELEALMSPADVTPGNDFAENHMTELGRTLGKVSKELRSRKADVATAIFVVETGLPRFDPARLDGFLRQHFDTVDYVFMARRQDTMVRSIIAQNMTMWEQKWSTLNPRYELLKFPRRRDFSALDYEKQLSRWASVVGDNHVIVVPYGEGDQGSFATIDRFFEFTQLGKAPRIDGITGLRIHPTFSAAGMRRLDYVKSVARWTWWFPPFRKRLNGAWNGAWHHFHENAIKGLPDSDGTPFASWALDSRDRRWVMRRFVESNRALRARQTMHAIEWDEWLRQVEEVSS